MLDGVDVLGGAPGIFSAMCLVALGGGRPHLRQLTEDGLADNTIVFYSTDNGPHMNTWPDGAMTPFRSEKNTNWEGAFRVPEMVRWPGRIPAGVVSNEIIQHHDWLPTFLAAAGEPDVVDKLTTGIRRALETPEAKTRATCT